MIIKRVATKFVKLNGVFTKYPHEGTYMLTDIGRDGKRDVLLMSAPIDRVGDLLALAEKNDWRIEYTSSIATHHHELVLEFRTKQREFLFRNSYFIVFTSGRDVLFSGHELMFPTHDDAVAVKSLLERAYPAQEFKIEHHINHTIGITLITGDTLDKLKDNLRRTIEQGSGVEGCLFFVCNNCGRVVELHRTGEGDHDTGYSCWLCDYVHYPRDGEQMQWVVPYYCKRCARVHFGKKGGAACIVCKQPMVLKGARR